MDTATPKAARDHARAQAGRGAPTAKTMPARLAADLPPGVDARDVVWAETLGSGGYSARRLDRGSRVRITDLDGGACAQVLLYNADNPVERLNVADTVKVQWNAYLGNRNLLLSDMGRVLASFVEDSCEAHDVLCGWSTPESNTVVFGDGDMFGAHPSGRDRFLQALARFGLSRADLMPSLNLFASVRVDDDGGLDLIRPGGDPGDHVTLRAEMNVLLIVVHAPHVLAPGPNYPTGRLDLLAHRGAVTAPDDAVRTASPEALRAFENTEDLFLR